MTQVISLGGFASLPAEVGYGLRQFAAGLRAGTDLRQAFVARMFSDSYARTHPDQVEDVLGWLLRSETEVIAAELEAAANAEDLRDHLRGLSIPILARVGELDASAPPSFSEEIARASPHAVLEVAKGCGHLLLIEDWNRTVASITRVLH